MHRVRIHTKDARAIAQGHPWVYREAIAERPRGLRTGAEVDVATAESDFVARGIYDADAPVAVRVWTRDRGERVDAATVARRARDAAAARERLGIPDATDAYRVVHGEADGLPGVLADRWESHLVVTLQGAALARIERMIVDGLLAALPADGVHVHTERGSGPHGDGGPESGAHHAAGDPAPEETTVREPSGRFIVRPAGTKPGLFTDMRDVRTALAPLTRGHAFLNLFAHTGAFSAAAAAAGAAQVVSVDLSRPYLEIARRNVALNAPAAAHEVVADDVFDTLRAFGAAGRRFGVVLADPPTFSSSRSTGAFNVRDHYRSLARGCLRVLEPGGLFVAASNWRALGTDDFLRTLHDAAEAERATLRVVSVMGQAADHPSLAMVPETRHLRVAFCLAAPPRAPA